MKKLKILLAISLLTNVILLYKVFHRPVHHWKDYIYHSSERAALEFYKDYRDNNSDDTFEGLPSNDLEFIDAVLEVFDRHVVNMMGDSIPLADACHMMFEQYEGLEGQEFPGLTWEENEELFYRIVTERLMTTFLEPRYSSAPDNYAAWNFVYKPAFYIFMEKTGKNNPFWTEAADAHWAAGSVSPTLIWSIINVPSLVDFTDKAQRFLVAMFFSYDAVWDNKDFLLKRDIDHNEEYHRSRGVDHPFIWWHER